MSEKVDVVNMKHPYVKKGKDGKPINCEFEYPESLKKEIIGLAQTYGKLRTILISPDDEPELVVIRCPDKLEYDKLQAAKIRSYDDDNKTGIEELQLLQRNIAPSFVVWPSLSQYVALDAEFPNLAPEVCMAALESMYDRKIKLGKGL